MSAFPEDFVMSTWTIFHQPADLPATPYVVREFYIRRGLEPEAAGVAVLCDSLDQARNLIPIEAVCIHRAPNDDPAIVETWL